MEINIEDIEETLRKEEERKVVEEIKSNVKRYIEIFYDIVQGIMPKRDMNINPEEDVFSRLSRPYVMSCRML